VVTLSELTNLVTDKPDTEFICAENLNLYDSPKLEQLATQAVAGRQLHILSPLSEHSRMDSMSGNAIQVCLREDDYSGWIAMEDLKDLDEAETPYKPMIFGTAEIRDRLPGVISYARLVMQQPNQYLWGGTVGPNYDCSGLMQAAFLSVGIWIPRDSYQQEAFTQTISLEEAEPGDLVFFGTPERVTHVGLYLGDRRYIHSSGKEIGRNGIGIDELSESGDTVSQNYFKLFKSVGRVTMTYPSPQS